MKDIQTVNLTPEQLKKLQWKNGWAVSCIGAIIYAVLLLCGIKPKDYCGICKCFEIGKSWGGFSAGWFFVCGKNVSEQIKHHEIGHILQNAVVGGLPMLLYTICSIIRYWYFMICKPNKSYYSWWFESQASMIGIEYMKEGK
jgi:hypothetical protein